MNAHESLKKLMASKQSAATAIHFSLNIIDGLINSEIPASYLNKNGEKSAKPLI